MSTDAAQSSRKVFKVVLVLALLLVVVVLAVYLWQKGFSLPMLGGRQKAYQAVFLTNGQVYFGKLAKQNSQLPVLTDIYYLQVNEVLQPVQGKRETQPAQRLSLAKLGTVELHKPQDLMRINRDHILFVEDLDADSQVVLAIKRYKQGLGD